MIHICTRTTRMAWSEEKILHVSSSSSLSSSKMATDAAAQIGAKFNEFRSSMTCPSCGHLISIRPHDQDLPGLPAGVKFDPTDLEILEHLEAKVQGDSRKLHPLLDEFIPTLDSENGICYNHPEKLPGVSKDGLIRHFFHRPSKAYTTGTRKRRKVQTDEEGGETRWHKTGKTRAVVSNGVVKGFKKILVLYTNYGRQKKPEKTNWVMHQYLLRDNEEEKDGELVASKVFYQTQPRQCGSTTMSTIVSDPITSDSHPVVKNSTSLIEYYHNPVVERNKEESTPDLRSKMVGRNHDGSSSFIGL
ncbi:hypothetical protein Droror1_Dr00020923 [Drosera rotundifolia]